MDNAFLRGFEKVAINPKTVERAIKNRYARTFSKQIGTPVKTLRNSAIGIRKQPLSVQDVMPRETKLDLENLRGVSKNLNSYQDWHAREIMLGSIKAVQKDTKGKGLRAATKDIKRIKKNTIYKGPELSHNDAKYLRGKELTPLRNYTKNFGPTDVYTRGGSWRIGAGVRG